MLISTRLVSWIIGQGAGIRKGQVSCHDDGVHYYTVHICRDGVEYPCGRDNSLIWRTGVHDGPAPSPAPNRSNRKRISRQPVFSVDRAAVESRRCGSAFALDMGRNTCLTDMSVISFVVFNTSTSTFSIQQPLQGRLVGRLWGS